jgi:hypothetical protein
MLIERWEEEGEWKHNGGVNSLKVHGTSCGAVTMKPFLLLMHANSNLQENYER